MKRMKVSLMLFLCSEEKVCYTDLILKSNFIVNSFVVAAADCKERRWWWLYCMQISINIILLFHSREQGQGSLNTLLEVGGKFVYYFHFVLIPTYGTILLKVQNFVSTPTPHTKIGGVLCKYFCRVGTKKAKERVER